MSIDYLSSLPFDGFAVGGSLGKNKDELIDLLSFVMPRLPQGSTPSPLSSPASRFLRKNV